MSGLSRVDIIRMAREAGIGWLERAEGISEFLERFANLVAAAERERIKWNSIHSCHADCQNPACVIVREAVAAEREKVAEWMMARAYATGHGETTEELLEELGWQIEEKIAREREACAKWCEAAMTDELDDQAYYVCKNLAAVIRERGAP